MSIEWSFKHASKLDDILGGEPYLIGGSFVANRDEANDVDVCIHEYIHTRVQSSLRSEGFRALRADDKKYDEIDRMRLMEVYEGLIYETKVNIIVVGASFWPAYVGAINEMANNKELYQTRDSRIALHRGLCKQLANMCGIDLEDKQL